MEILEDRGVRSPSLCSICCVKVDLLEGERPRSIGGAWRTDMDMMLVATELRYRSTWERRGKAISTLG